ncbi:protein kinase [Strigomonas culicis]|uniref:Protein kinase n=1 Tax=Strigomonas culicis TaxID=28005 RepID=S9UTL1_9TRYP|nr:protein kinase [Strigomonas culicis]|eukprot:EPY34287.1 protein kinase [Strigomonas culicis]
MDPFLHILFGLCFKPHGLPAYCVERKNKVPLRRRAGHRAHALYLFQAKRLCLRVRLRFGENEMTFLHLQVALFPRVVVVPTAELLHVALEGDALVDLSYRIVSRLLYGFVGEDFCHVRNKRLLHRLRDARILLDRVHEHFEALAHIRKAKDIPHAGSLIGIAHEDLAHHVAKVGGKAVRQRLIVATKHFGHEPLHIRRGEGALQRHNLVQQNTQRPDIRLLAVPLVVPELWCKVVGRAAEGVRDDARDGVVVLVTKPKITQFDQTRRCQQHVRAFNVAVKHLVAVDVVEREAQLQKKKQRFVLLKILEGVLRTVFDLPVEVARVRKLHHNEQVLVFLVVFHVLNNVRVVANREALDLAVGVAPIAR